MARTDPQMELFSRPTLTWGPPSPPEPSAGWAQTWSALLVRPGLYLSAVIVHIPASPPDQADPDGRAACFEVTGEAGSSLAGCIHNPRCERSAHATLAEAQRAAEEWAAGLISRETRP